MAKRKPLSFDNQELTANLERSAAKGMDAFFSPAAVPVPEPAKTTSKESADSSTDERHSPPKLPTKKTPLAGKAKLEGAKVPTVSQKTESFEEIIQAVRKSVKVVGKEMSTHRMTPEEKKEIVDLVYSYRGTGTRTSENEIARIAINFLIEDYKQNGETSILHKVLLALNE